MTESEFNVLANAITTVVKQHSVATPVQLCELIRRKCDKVLPESKLQEIESLIHGKYKDALAAVESHLEEQRLEIVKGN